VKLFLFASHKWMRWERAEKNSLSQLHLIQLSPTRPKRLYLPSLSLSQGSRGEVWPGARLTAGHGCRSHHGRRRDRGRSRRNRQGQQAPPWPPRPPSVQAARATSAAVAGGLARPSSTGRGKEARASASKEQRCQEKERRKRKGIFDISSSLSPMWTVLPNMTKKHLNFTNPAVHWTRTPKTQLH
jgi:hypothetical protein